MPLRDESYYEALAEAIRLKLQESEEGGMYLNDLMYVLTAGENRDCDDDDVERAVLILERDEVVQRGDTSNPGETYIELIG